MVMPFHGAELPINSQINEVLEKYDNTESQNKKVIIQKKARLHWGK